jgi:hypothetical protein
MSEKIDINRRINIIMPYHDPIIAYAQYVQKTKDGKYVLSYLQKHKDDIIPNFTEIINIDGQWYKSPFHLDYEKYDFEEFNSELSKEIIDALPDNMKLRIIFNDRKIIKSEEENINKVEINSLGATEITDKVEQDVYYTLIANSSEDIIKNDDYFPYDFPFPAFAIEGKDNHINADYEGNTNKDVEFNELEFSRYGLSVGFRKEIVDFIKGNNVVIRINDLPILELEDDDEKVRVHFVNCPEITTFNSIYKAKSLFVDCELTEDISITELLKRAFNDEIPYYCESELGTKKDNGVRHTSLVK